MNRSRLRKKFTLYVTGFIAIFLFCSILLVPIKWISDYIGFFDFITGLIGLAIFVVISDFVTNIFVFFDRSTQDRKHAKELFKENCELRNSK
jgi:Ca2+/Na+ antiporter